MDKMCEPRNSFKLSRDRNIVSNSSTSREPVIKSRIHLFKTMLLSKYIQFVVELIGSCKVSLFLATTIKQY